MTNKEGHPLVSGTDLTVVFISGWLRSGTTLVSEAIGGFRNCIAVGELSGIWLAFEMDRRCSCGEPISECIFWSEVLARYKNSEAEQDISLLAELAKSVLRTRVMVPSLALRRFGKLQESRDYQTYSKSLETLLHCIAAESGANTIVDSSKLPPVLLVERKMPSMRTRVVHIVRDPRAVVFSESRSNRNAGTLAAEELPPQQSAIRSLVNWVAANLLGVALFASDSTATFLTYEQLASDLAGTSAFLATSLGLETGESPLSSGHIAVGNPARLLGSSRTVQIDDRWKHEMAKPMASAIAVVGLPIYWRIRRISRQAAKTVNDPSAS